MNSIISIKSNNCQNFIVFIGPWSTITIPSFTRMGFNVRYDILIVFQYIFFVDGK